MAVLEAMPSWAAPVTTVQTPSSSPGRVQIRRL